jgi:hypothetical protein
MCTLLFPCMSQRIFPNNFNGILHDDIWMGENSTMNEVISPHPNSPHQAYKLHHLLLRTFVKKTFHNLLKSRACKGAFWKIILLIFHTSIADGHCHRIWNPNSTSKPHKGHRGSIIIRFLHKFSQVGSISLHVRHNFFFHTRNWQTPNPLPYFINLPHLMSFWP